MTAGKARDTMRNIIWSYLLLLCLTGSVLADSPNRDENIVSLRPYDGISAQGVDTSTLSGKVMCGYQGWFTTLVDQMHIGRDERDRAYLHEGGNPVVAVWGVGFNDGRRYTLDECEELVRFLKHDEKYGGCTVMLGVPTGWRTLDRDSVTDKKLHDVIFQADIVSPWTVGRYSSLQSVARHAEDCWRQDISWCEQHEKKYLPVVFPGFSWHNLKPGSPLDQIPRQQGQFLWTQYVQAKKAGATMI